MLEIPTIKLSKQYKDKDWLYSQYIEERLTRKDIGLLCGVKERTIKKWLEIYDIKKFDNVLYKDKDWLYKKYVILEESLWSIAEELKCSPTTIKKWLDKYEIPIRTNGESISIYYARYGHPSKGRITSDEQKLRLSLLRRGKVMGDEHPNWKGGPIEISCPICGATRKVECWNFRKAKNHFCSSRCNAIYQRKFGVVKNKETKIEKKMEEWLKANDILYDKQHLIVFDKAFTVVDFFIKPNICLYADGDYWHSLPEVKKRDKEQNRRLPELGYRVVRVSGTNINKGNYPKNLIGDILNDRFFENTYNKN